MAKIKLNGDTSGYIEISAPAVSGNNTLELGPGTKILTNLDNTFTGITTFSNGIHITSGGFILNQQRSDTHASLIIDKPDAGTGTLKFFNNGSASAYIQHTNSEHLNYYLPSGSGYHAFYTNGTERLRITSSGESKFTVGTNKFVKFYAPTHNDEADLGAGIAFSRPSDGADMLSGMFAHSNTGLGIAARDHVTILTGGTSTVSDTEERLRITSAGFVGINETSPDTYLHVKTSTDSALAKLEQTATNGRVQIQYLSPHGNWYQGIVGASNTGDFLIYTGQSKNLTFHTNGELRQKIQSDGKVIIGGNANQAANRDLSVVAAPGNSNEVQLGLQPTNSSGNYNPEAFISAIADGSYGAHMYFKTRDTSGNRLERLRITSDGKIGIGVGSPSQMLEITNTASTGAQIQLRDTSTAQGSSNGFRVGYNGSGGQLWNFESTYIRFATSNSERLRILSNGHVNIGGYLTSVSNSGLHVGRSSGGTAAGESVIAATLGNGSTMVSALLTVKNAGNRGSAGHVSGSPLAKFEFNNGTAFEIDKNGYRTLPYQPAFSVRRNSSQDIPHNTNTKIQWNTEIFDVGGNFDSSTNFRFTAPVAGKYLFLGHLYIYSTLQVEAKIYKNGSIYKRFSGPVGTGGNDNPNGMDFMDIIDLSVNDYVEIYGYHYRSGDTSTVSIYGGNNKETSFVGYLLG